MRTTLKSLLAAVLLAAAVAAPAEARPDPEVIVRAAPIPGTNTIAWACTFHTVRAPVMFGSFTCDDQYDSVGNVGVRTGTKEASADGTWQICWSYWVRYLTAGSASGNDCVTGTI